MLGVSIQKLQLLGAMPRHVIEGLQRFMRLGFYPNVSTIDSNKLPNIMVVAILILNLKIKNRPSACFFVPMSGNIRYCSITIITALIRIRLMCWRFASACELNNEHAELKEQYEWQCK